MKISFYIFRYRDPMELPVSVPCLSSHCVLYFQALRPYGRISFCSMLFYPLYFIFSGTETLWTYLFLFHAFPAIVSLVGFVFLPDSPRYLMLEARDRIGAEKGKYTFSVIHSNVRLFWNGQSSVFDEQIWQRTNVKWLVVVPRTSYIFWFSVTFI